MEMELTIGPKHLLKKAEFIRILTGALYSLGFDRIATLLEQDSCLTLYDDTTKQFLNHVKDEEWDKAILTLNQFHLRDDRAARFLLLEQKVLHITRTEGVLGLDKASRVINAMVTLNVNYHRCTELRRKIMYGLVVEEPTPRSKVFDKLLKLLLRVVRYPENRLQCLLEESIDSSKRLCDAFHNVPDSQLSLYSDHHCGNTKLPSKTLQILEGHTDEVLFLKFSHNGNYLASSSKDKSAIIWEVDTEGKLMEKHRLLGHEKPVVVVVWSPDDKQVITCGKSEVIRRYDVESGDFLQVYERNGVGSVSCGWYYDGSGLFGAMADKRIYMWNLDGSEVPHLQPRRAGECSDLAITSDGKWLVSVGREHEIVLFDRLTGAANVFGELDMITSFSLSSDDKHVLINLITHKIHLLNIDEEPYKCLEFVGDKDTRFITRSCFGGYEECFIASGSEDSQVYIWSSKATMLPCCVLAGHSKAVNCVGWNPKDMHMLASASDDGTIRIWGLDDSIGN